MESVKIWLLSISSAVVYGILHDQITARVCVEYFTIGHRPIFNTESPTLLAFGWGIIATWWVGCILGVPLAIAARVGSRPKLSARAIVKPIIRLLLFMGLISLIFGIVGFFSAEVGVINLLSPLSEKVPVEKHSLFIADLWAHTAAYVSGLVGGIVLCIWIWLTRITQRS